MYKVSYSRISLSNLRKREKTICESTTSAVKYLPINSTEKNSKATDVNKQPR